MQGALIKRLAYTLIWSLILGTGCFPVPVWAADEAVAVATPVRITVFDASSKRPVPRAHVRLLGDAGTYEGFTDNGGAVTISVTIHGRYGVRVDADAYEFARDGIVTANGATPLSVSVVGTRTRPAKIGSTTAKVKSSGDTPVGSIGDTPSQIAGSVGASLPNNSALGVDSTGALTIHGHDSSTTAVTLNGAAIFPTNTQNQFGLLNSDVLSAAALSSPTGGSPNGTLNTQTYDPTIDWTGVVQMRGSSFDGNGNALQQRGTVGRFGLAAVHSSNEDGNPLTGRFFLDTSGQAYSHFADPISTGDTFTTRYGFDSSHFAYLDLGRLSAVRPTTCSQQFGVLPCGFGPGNYSSSENDYIILRDTLLIDRGSIDLHLFESKSTNIAQFGANRIPGFAAGTDDRSVTNRTGASGKLSYTFGKRRDVTLDFSSLHDTSSAQNVFSTPQFTLAPQTANTTSVKLGVPIFSIARFGLNVSFGSDSSGGVSQGTFDTDTHYSITPRDSVNARFGTGHLASLPGSSNSFSLATELEPDCNAGRVLGAGPQSAPLQPGATQNVSAGFTHSGARVGFGATLFRETDRNANVFAVLPAGAIPGFALTPGYIATASQAATNACGSPQNVSLSNLFYSISAPVERKLSSGVDANASADIGARIKLTATYSFLSARAFGTGLPFAAGSNVIAGLQLPQQPMHKAQFQASGALSSATSILASINYSGANNLSSQQPFTRFDLGLRAQTKTGDVVLAVQNIGNAAAPLFGGFDGFPNIITPQTPRTYSVRYRLAIGRRGIDRATALTSPFNTSRGVIFMAQSGIEEKTEDWLAINTSNSLCGPELLPQATSYKQGLTAYTESVRLWALQGRDLATAPTFDLDGLGAHVVRGGSDYAIMITFDFKQSRKINAFTRCQRLHFADAAEAQRLKIYSPPWEERDAVRTIFELYSPRVGLYFAPEVPNQTRPGGLGIAFSNPVPLRKQAPANPYAIDEKACPASYHDAVASTLIDLKNYITAFYNGGHPSAPEGLAIVQHNAKAERWLEIKAETTSFTDALATCVGAPSTDDKSLAEVELNGAPFPSLNYAPKIGFYRVFPTFNFPKPKESPGPAGSPAPKPTPAM